MATHRATCEDCHEEFTDPDLLKVSEWAEDHERTEFHDVRIEKTVATDGGWAVGDVVRVDESSSSPRASEEGRIRELHGRHIMVEFDDGARVGHDRSELSLVRVATDGGEDLDDIPGEYLHIDELSDLPECRIVATADPAGMLRFEMTTDRGEALLENVEETIDAAPAQPDGLVELVIILDYPAYASLTKGLAQLHRAPEPTTKQVRVEPDEPDLAVAVAVNASQIESSMRKNYAALKQFGEDRVYGQRFGVSRNGLVALAQQLEAALDGHGDPLDVVDEDDERFTHFDDDPDAATDGGRDVMSSHGTERTTDQRWGHCGRFMKTDGTDLWCPHSHGPGAVLKGGGA